MAKSIWAMLEALPDMEHLSLDLSKRLLSHWELSLSLASLPQAYITICTMSSDDANQPVGGRPRIPILTFSVSKSQYCNSTWPYNS